MTDLSIYFQPLSSPNTYAENQIGSKIQGYFHEFPELNGPACAIFSIPEFRGAQKDKQQTPVFRNAFYQLHPQTNWTAPLYDLGTIEPGASVEDTYFAIANVVSELVKQKIVPIIIGGSQDLTMAIYKGYEKLEQLVNTCAIDRSLDIGSAEASLQATNYLSHMLTQRPCFLFNHSVIGVQLPHVCTSELELFEKLFFDTCRLGEFNQDFRLAEPHLRNADIISIDLGALKAADLGLNSGAANGFTAAQFCQITKYAGISDKVTSIGFFTQEALGQLGGALLAEGIWYFLQGYFSRVGDFPFGGKSDYAKFTVFMDEVARELVFYKSNKSARWWMEVPYPPQSGRRFERHHMVPCNKSDYDNAMNNELPDLWWKTYQKLG
jgi:formiminoglutamase